MKKSFAIIGTGIVGTALAVLLERAGLECIGVNTRSQASYERFNQYLTRKHLSFEEISNQADLIFITTQDKEIEKVAEKLTIEKTRKQDQFWIHCSGSLRSALMCKNPSLRVSYLSIHPLQAFADIENALIQVKGTHFGIEGDTLQSEQMGEQLVEILGGIAHRIDADHKTLYHAGAVVASNYLVSLAYLAVKLLEEAGINKDEALRSLLPLIKGSYQNIVNMGLPRALTGPIARGDEEVVAKHLQEMPPQLRETYKSLGQLALELGKENKLFRNNRYAAEDLAHLQELLAPACK